jgi:hypothetical protein
MKDDLSTFPYLSSKRVAQILKNKNLDDLFCYVVVWKAKVETELKERRESAKELVEFDKSKHLTDLWAKDQETVDRITEFLGDNR